MRYLVCLCRQKTRLKMLKNLVGGLDRTYKTVWAFLLSKHVLQWVFGHAKPTTQGVQYNEELCRFSIHQKSDETNVELSSIYLGIWPHYIGNPHTNERDLSAGIDRLPRACLTSLADLSLQLHTTSGVAEIYICNNGVLA